MQFHLYKIQKQATLSHVNKSLESGYWVGGAKMNGRRKRKSSAVFGKVIS